MGAARAQAAADAAAQELAVGSSGSAPGDLAAEYAGRNKAVVTVTVQVGALLLAPDDRVVTARARAVVDVPAP